jgi:hypothetical protein
LSNPLQNIDPRSLTQFWPVFLGGWVKTPQALPDANFQVYGAGLNLALTDRLSVGLNQGGYATAHIDPAGRRFFRGRDFGGSRDGFLNLGGFVQYTLIEDVPDQFLLTTGLRVVVPSGSTEMFQGKGPTQLAPYVTVGQEIGNFHVLATGGYQFPTGTGDKTSNLFYLNAHLDRQFFGWVYPLVEFNWTYHTTAVDLSGLTRRGYFDLNNFSVTGNVLAMSAGVNFVLIRDRLEFGGVYSFPLATQRNVGFNTMLVRLTLRY